MRPIVYFASDHAGFHLKNELLSFVRDTLRYDVVDCGATTYDEQDDFTDFIVKAAREVSIDPEHKKAIILGGSGQGEAMLANRFHDVRAAVYYGGDVKIISLSRIHNNANVLSLGARFIGTNQAKEAVALWLDTPHTQVKKHDRRIEEIELFSKNTAPVLHTDTLIRTLVPSLPAHSFDELITLFTALQGVALGIQVDIADGQFVQNTSWPFTQQEPGKALQALSPYTSRFELEIDCMCLYPERYLEIFAELGVTRVIIHAGSTEKMDDCITHAQNNGYKIGLAVTNQTSPEVLGAYEQDIDFVQVMGIQHIGKQGEPFDAKTVETVAHIRNLYPGLEIAVDGGVNAGTITQLLQAGANRFAPGSAITKAADPATAYKELADMVGL